MKLKIQIANAVTAVTIFLLHHATTPEPVQAHVFLDRSAIGSHDLVDSPVAGSSAVDDFLSAEQSVSSNLLFSVTKGPGILALEAGNPAQQATAASVVAGFNAAADLWRAYLVDAVTVNVTLDFTPLGNAGGATFPVFDGYDFATAVRPALIAESKSLNDAIAIASLPAPLATGIDFMTNDTTITPSPRIRDNDGSINNAFLAILRANAKALGLRSANDPDSDGEIRLNSLVSWDFNPSDGIHPARVDFIGIAAHEIGHLLGFFSGVDFVDILGSDGIPPESAFAGDHIDLDPLAAFNVIDLFRYSNDSLSQPNQPAGGLLDWAFGEPAAGDTPFFSIDAGGVNLATFSTGQFNGDGRQASHWEDDLGLGIMDPTARLGELLTISALDVNALDVIGWDLRQVPEPTTLSLVLGSALLLLLVRRYRN